MEVYDALLSRRSIRRFSDRKIENEMVDKFIKAGMYAPSAANKQPWHFLVFSQRQTVDSIISVHPHASMLEAASTGILVCFDEKLQHAEGYGIIDCAAAIQNILLAAHGSGIGSCWIGVLPRKERMNAMRDIFNLPAGIIPHSLIALGYPDEVKNFPDRYRADRIHHETW